MWINLRGAPEELLLATSAGLPIAAADYAAATMGIRGVDLKNLLDLGLVRIDLEPWIHDALRVASEAQEAEASQG